MQQPLIAWEPKANFTVRGDRLLLCHVLMNLINNALSSITSVEKGEIFISIYKDDKSNYIVVEDTGRGMTEKEVKRIFDRFFSKTPGGAGLGLAFCNRVIRSFGGSLSCQSEFGEYTRMIITLPNIDEALEQDSD